LKQLSFGVDIESVSRVELAVSRSGERFLNRIFSGPELDRSGDMVFLTTRFAAKEAFFKALGTGVTGGVRWHDFILPEPADGVFAPQISGRCKEILSGGRVHVSVSGTDMEAVAVVIIEDSEDSR